MTKINWKSALLAVVLGLITFSLIILIFWKLDESQRELLEQKRKSETYRTLSRFGSSIQLVISRHIHSVQALQAFVSVNPDVSREQFKSLSQVLVREDPGIRSLTLLRDNIISDVYPFEENRSALNFKVLEDENQAPDALKAIASGKPWFSGPIRLRQGGSAFIIRCPVYQVTELAADADPVTGKYWGLVSVLVDYDQITKEINRILPDGHEVLVQYRNDRDDSPGIVFGDESLLDDESKLTTIKLTPTPWIVRGRPMDQMPASEGQNQLWLQKIFLALGVGVLVGWMTLNANRMSQMNQLLEKSNAALKVAGERLEMVLVGADIGFWDWNTVNNFVYFSDTAKTQLGYPADAKWNHLKDFEERLHPADAEDVQQAIHAYLSGEVEDYHPIFRLRCADDTYRWIMSVGVAEFDDERKPKKMLGIHIDVDYRIQAEEQIRRDRQDVQLILDSLPSFVYFKDTRNNILRVNQAVADALGFERNIIEGKNASEFYPADADSEFLDDLEVIKSRKAKVGVVKKLGDRWLQTDKIPILNSEGKVYRLIVVATDITHSRMLEEQTHRSRIMLEQTSRLAEVGGWEVDLTTRQAIWSDEVCRIHEVDSGYTPSLEESLDYYTDQSGPKIKHAVWESLEKPASWDLELSMVTAKGNHRWVRAIGQSEFKDGKITRLVGSLQNITEQKKARSRLQLTQHTVDFSIDAIFFVLRDGSIAYSNTTASKYLNYSREQISEMKIFEFDEEMTSDDWQNRWQELKESMVLISNSVFTRSDQTQFECETKLAFFEFDDQEIVVATIRDISKSHRERQLRNLLFERSNDAHLLFDESGIIECNQAAVEMLGMKDKSEVMSHHPAEFSPEYQSDGQRSLDKSIQMDSIAHEKGFHRFDWIHQKQDGTEFPCEVTLTPVELDTGRALLVVWHDISERVEREQQLNEINSKLASITSDLQKSNQLLSESNLELQQFAYVASHDLQTPLRGIAGFSEFLRDEYEGKLDETADDYIGRIVGGCQRMQQLINDLLSFSRVESKATEFTTIDLGDVFADAKALSQAEIEANDAEITAGKLPEVKGDSAQLSQLFQNLIGNAIKYRTDQNPVVKISAVTDEQWVTIQIEDNGIGIEPLHHDRIFQIFKRLHSQQEYPGTGIGLAVCRRIVTRHGGKIWVESNGDKGSVFKFTLPNHAEI